MCYTCRLLHGQGTEVGILSERVVRRRDKTKRNKKRGGKCMAMKSDPLALLTGNDKFRISFSHVQCSLLNRKPAKGEKNYVNYSLVIHS